MNTQPLAGSQLSVVQGFLSTQLMAVPTHCPFAQTSPVVQRLPSLQGSVFGVKTQPSAGAQLSVVHGFLSSHTIDAPAHFPPVHTSAVVQALPSSHLLEFGV